MVEVLTFLTLLHCHKHLLAKETSGQNTILPRQGSWVCSANGADDITGHVLNKNTIAVSLATTCISTPLYIPKQGSCSIFLSSYVTCISCWKIWTRLLMHLSVYFGVDTYYIVVLVSYLHNRALHEYGVCCWTQVWSWSMRWRRRGVVVIRLTSPGSREFTIRPRAPAQ